MSPPESKAQSDVPGPPNTSQQDPIMIPWLKRNEWKLIFAIAALSFVLGALGIHQQQLAVGKPLTWGDAVYFSLRLFTFSYDQQGEGTPYATVSPLLEVARFLAPAAVFSAAVDERLTPQVSISCLSVAFLGASVVFIIVCE